jgi:hypothetical protein
LARLPFSSEFFVEVNHNTTIKRVVCMGSLFDSKVQMMMMQQQELDSYYNMYDKDRNNPHKNSNGRHFVVAPVTTAIDDKRLMFIPDYGGLEIQFLLEDYVPRPIYHRSSSEMSLSRFKIFQEIIDDSMKNVKQTVDMDNDGYYAFDDDYQRGIEGNYDGRDHLAEGKRCRRISAYRNHYPTCNNVHETGLLDSKVEFLGKGAYREVFMIHRDVFTNDNAAEENIVLKEVLYQGSITSDGSFEKVRMDALSKLIIIFVLLCTDIWDLNL